MVRSFITVCWVRWEHEHASIVLEVVYNNSFYGLLLWGRCGESGKERFLQY